MRKVLIAAVVAVVLFAVGAFAASFIVDAEDIASGTDDVVACAESVQVDFKPAVRVSGDWVTRGANLTFTDNGANPEGCQGKTVTVVVQTTPIGGGPPTTLGTPNDDAATGTATISAGNTADVTWSPATDPKVREVTGVDVLVEGITVPSS